MKSHLNVSTSDRGFDHLPPIEGAYGGQVRVYESSSAEGPHIWLNAKDSTDDATLHLTAADAVKLAEQIMFLIKHHYQN